MRTGRPRARFARDQSCGPSQSTRKRFLVLLCSHILGGQPGEKRFLGLVLVHRCYGSLHEPPKNRLQKDIENPPSHLDKLIKTAYKDFRDSWVVRNALEE